MQNKNIKNEVEWLKGSVERVAFHSEESGFCVLRIKVSAMESIGRYVEDANLKKILRETSVIGTQATRAAIIETFIKREYISL